jgi:glutamine amidotransferase
MKTAIVDAGCGNLRSVARAVAEAGGDPVVTSDATIVAGAARVVMPGQGAFKDCMAGLAGGLGDAVRAHIAAGRPYFGICLGLQILFNESDEQGPCVGLGVLPGRVVRFRDAPGVKIPHMGWNSVSAGAAELPVARGTHFYFVHSFYGVPADAGAVALTADYAGVRFCAAVRHEAVWATQFHPEKSQRAGIELLRSFLCS